MKKTFTLLLAVVMTTGVATSAMGESLEELLSQVGESYATGYASPFLYAFGPSQNANLYNSASVPWGKLKFGVGVKFMGTYLDESDQSFRTVYEDVDLHDYLPDQFPDADVYYGDIVLGGPTMFGDTGTNGSAKAYYNGLEVASVEGIPGLVDTRWVPMFTPEGYIGGIFGLRAVIRWLPSYTVEDYGKFEYMGLGLQWSTTGLLKEFPVDLMVGYFSQEMKVGELIKSTGSSLHIAASKSLPALTVYGGYAIEDSEMDMSYTYIDEANNIEESISFNVKGRQEHRWTLGVTLDIFVKLNLEMGHGDLTTYSAGLMFGN